MENWKSVLLKSTDNMLKAAEILEKGRIQFAVVVDEKLQIQGTITDGDIRRALIRGLGVNTAVDQFMNKHPLVGNIRQSLSSLEQTLKEKRIRQIPLVDDEGCLSGVHVLQGVETAVKRLNQVVLVMGDDDEVFPEGGQSSRFKVGRRPYIHTLIETFCDQGFENFVIVLGERSEKIRAYLSDGGVDPAAKLNIITRKEDQSEAEVLNLLNPDIFEGHPFILMRGSLLTKINFNDFLDFHLEDNSLATLGVREYQQFIPYGVINTEGAVIQSLVEKPTYKYIVDGCIYIFDPKVLTQVHSKKLSDISVLTMDLLESKENVKAYPINEFWMDLGRVVNVEELHQGFAENFLLKI